MIRATAAALLGGALTLAAAAFGVASLYVPGFALVIAGGAAAGWVVVASRGARVERVTGGATVEEGERYRVELNVSLPFGSAELTDPLVGSARARSGTTSVDAAFARRGRRTLEPAALTVTDPLRLAERTLTSDEHEVLVLPRVEAIESAAARGGHGSADAGALMRHEAALEFDSLRPYRAGAPASRIHWPTVARRGAIMERRLVAEADTRPLVVVDAAQPDTDEALDRALRAAASLAVHLARAGGCALALPGDRRAATIDRDLRSWPSLHVRLALVEAGGTAFAARGGGPLVWITARSGDVPSALGRAPAAARWLVLPAPLRGRTPAFAVAGCTVHRLERPARSAA